MKLQSLHLVGFKTFGQDTHITFNPGVSAIVGPNGSGKSNVVDAIAWVLGEQSPSTLRIKRTSELIYQPADGNTARNMASVELAIQDAHEALPAAGAEMTIARTGYRDGDSEFYLNGGRTVRKHIRALFAPYGMAQRTFSVIRQGNTDRLLDVNPHNRLRAIQEAAGVLGLIQQKEEALQRLERTREQLQPVHQELRELRLGMTHLERQARQFKRRQALLTELQQVLVPYYRHHFHVLARERVTNQADLARMREQRSHLESACQQNRDTQTDLRRRYQQTAADLEELQATIGHVEQSLHQDLRQHDVLEERQRQYRAQLDALTRNQADRHQRCNRMVADIEQLHKQLRGLDSRLQEAKQDVVHKRAALEHHRVQQNQHIKQLNAARQQLEGLDQRIGKVTRQQVQLNLDVQLLAQTVKAQETTEHTLRLQHEQTVQRQQSQQQSQQNLKQQQQQARATLAEARQQTELDEAQAAELQQKRHHLDRHLASLTARKASWDEYLVTRMEQFTPLSVDNLDNGQVMGILGSLLVVPPQYQKPVAACLGEWVHSLVFYSWDDACTVLQTADAAGERQAVQVAALERLPASIRPDKPHPDVQLLQEVIEYPPELDALLRVLLADYYVVDNMQMALQHLGVYESCTPLHMVTLSGDRLSSTGLIRLQGTGETDMQLLRMQHEVQILETDIDQARADLERYIQAWEQTAHTAEVSRQKQQACQEQLVMADMAVQQVEQELAELDRAGQQQRSQLEQLHAERVQNQTRSREQQAKVERHQQTLEELQAERENRLDIIRQLEQILADQVEVSWSQELETAIQALQAVEQEVGSLQERKVQLARAQKVLEQDLETGQAQAASLDAELEVVTQEMAELMPRIARAREDLEHKRDTLAPRVQASQHFVREQQELDQTYESLLAELRAEEAQIHALELAQAQLQEHQATLDARLVSDWELMGESTMEGMDWDEFRVQVQPAPVPDSLQTAEEANGVVPEAHLTTLRRQITRIGPVQEDLYRAFQDAESHSSRLETQLTDLAAAEEQLWTIVQRLDDQLANKTHRAFQEINRNFNEYFARFFPGGQGWLELTDKPDEATAGVELYLRLPGKHVQHVTALSGGERAMVALAFICGMLKFNRPPFCVLDEIDAPLDETNVDRIGYALRDLAQHTQLILITHNQRMLEHADAIWGVTLDGAGCSQVLSMRLDHSFPWMDTPLSLQEAEQSGP